MNFERHFINKLQNNGLWPDEATAIVEVAKANPVFKDFQNRWYDDTTGYPPQMLPALWLGMKHIAGEWLKANKPLHWALPMFTDKLPT